MRSQPSRSGFSLIEALVALAIASMTLMAIFELQIQMARGQDRAIRAIEQVAAQENALALIKDINFSVQPDGEIELPDGDQISWQSEPLTQPRRNMGRSTGYGNHEVQLHRVTVSIQRRTGPSPAPMQLDRIGWVYAPAHLSQ
jgi:general secretion pathway protein I